MTKTISFIIVALLAAAVFSSCCSTSKMTNKPPEQATIPPQNADIKISVLEIVTSGDNIYCNAKVDEVTGYGPSTPPLAQGQIIKIYFPAKVVEQEKIAAEKHLYVRASWLSKRDSSGYWNFEKLNEIN